MVENKEKIMPKGIGTYGSTVGRPAKPKGMKNGGKAMMNKGGKAMMNKGGKVKHMMGGGSPVMDQMMPPMRPKMMNKGGKVKRGEARGGGAATKGLGYNI